jgi:diguanylate cyclase (GGDEF)-like protein
MRAARQSPFYTSMLALAVDRPRTGFFAALHAALAERATVDFIEAVTVDAGGERHSLYRAATDPDAAAFHVDEALVDAAIASGRAQRAGPALIATSRLYPVRPGAPSLVVAPLRVDGGVRGYLAVGANRPAAYGDAEFGDVAAAADVASLVVNATLSSDAARSRDEELRVLLDTARALSSERDLRRLFARIHDLVGGIMDASTFFIGLVKWDAGTVVIPYCVDLGHLVPGGEYTLENSASGHVLRQNRPLIFRTLDDWKSMPNVSTGEGDPVQSALFSPLRIGDRPIGVISVQSPMASAYSERDLTLLVAVAEQAAIAVEHSEALMQAEQQTRELQLLAEVSRALSAHLSLDALYRTVCQEVRRVLDASVFFVGLLSYDGSTLNMEYCVQGDVEVKLDPLPLAQSIADRVVRSNAPVVLQTQPEIRSAPFHRLHVDGEFAHSIAMAPLRLGSRCLGVISAQSYKERAYDESAVRLLAAIAEQMALAVQNARMFADAQSRADRDPLTNIYHHRYLKTRLEEEIKRAGRSDGTFAVLMLDLDRFKLVNDNYGHPAGDEALRMMTAVLLSTCRGSDVVGRYGGDEFLIILTDADEAHALNVAQRIRDELGVRVLELAGARIPLSASIGVAEFPRDGRCAGDLIARADAALYQSKRAGVPIGGADNGSGPAIRLKGDFAPVAELLAALLARDPTTRTHLEQVNQLADRFAQAAGFTPEESEALLLASVLHDVGKIAIPNHVLCKPTGLTPDERRLVKRHPEVGAMLLEHVAGFSEVARTVLHHHERYDGAGYPRGLAGDAIPKLSRVVSIIDAYSAMTDDRPYHKGMTQESAIAELRRCSGMQFDPEMVELFAALIAGG